jgi:hypothetical protein
MLPAAVLVIVNKLVEVVLRIPDVNVRVPDESGPEREIPFGLLTIKLLRLVTLEGIVIPAEDPPNTKVDDVVVDRLLGVPAIAGPLRVRVFAPIVKVPAVRVRVPFKDKSAPNVIFLLVLKLFSPPDIAFNVISAPVPIVRLDVELPVNEPVL